MFLYLCASFCEREYDSLEGYVYKAILDGVVFRILIDKGISNECKKSNP